MVNHSVDDDSDEELGAYIYRTSRTAELLREEVVMNNETSTNNNDKSNNIPTRKSKRKKQPLEGEDHATPAVSTRAKKRVRKQCTYEGCTNYAQKGDVCIRHGAKKKRCKYEG